MIAIVMPPSICRMPTKKRRNTAAKKSFKKAAGAPKRFKSAYMFFSIQKNKDIRLSAENKLVTTEVAKMISMAWKSMSAEERAVWDEMARKDKERYQREKANYKGPWKVLVEKPRGKKAVPMSAFCYFRDEHKALVKTANPNATNVEISGILSKMWQESGPIIKQLYASKAEQQDASTKQDDVAEDMSESSQEDMPASNNAEHHSEVDATVSCDASLDLNMEDDWLTGRIQAVQSATMQERQVSEDGSFKETTVWKENPSFAPMLSSPSPFWEDPTGLAPLVKTDDGNFLAAAAALDTLAMESLPFSIEDQDVLDAHTELHHDEMMSPGVENVLLSLSDECFNEEDLPEAGS